jgi:hypothetical protein
MQMPQELLADAVIRDCDGCPRAAVIALLKIMFTLQIELHELTGKAGNERASAGGTLTA